MKGIIAVALAFLVLASPIALAQDQPLLAQDDSDRPYIKNLHAVGRGIRLLLSGDTNDFQIVKLAIGSIVRPVTVLGSEQENQAETTMHRVGAIEIIGSEETYRYFATGVTVDENGKITFEIRRRSDKIVVGSGELEPFDRSGMHGFAGTLTLDDPQGLNDGEGKTYIIVPSNRKPDNQEKQRAFQELRAQGIPNPTEVDAAVENAHNDIRFRNLLVEKTEMDPDGVAQVIAKKDKSDVARTIKALPIDSVRKIADTAPFKTKAAISKMAQVKNQLKITNIAENKLKADILNPDVAPSEAA